MRFVIYLVCTLTFCHAINAQVQESRAKDNPEKARISSAQLLVRNLKSSALWYRRHLGFQIKDVKMNESAKLKIQGFEIQMKQPQRTVLASSLKLPKGKMQINGFQQIGFKTSYFDSLYAFLDEKNVRLDSIKESPLSPERREFIAYDPDGNKLLFSEMEVKKEARFPDLTPYSYSLITADFKNTISWYERSIGFQQTHNLDSPNKNRFCRIMQLDEIVLEIIYSPNRSMETTELLSYDIELAGYQKIGINLEDQGTSTEVLDNDGNILLVKK